MTRVPEPADRPVITRPVDYFELGVFTFSILWGVTSLIRYSDTASPAVKAYPGIGGVVFLALLVAGGATGLVSFLFKTITGPRLELAGLTLLDLLCLAYGLWTPFSVGVRGTGLLLSLVILIAVPGYFTARRLARYIKAVEAIEDKYKT